MNRVVFLLMVTILLGSCSKLVLDPGKYSTIEEGKAAFAGTDIFIQPNNRIQINHWSDTGGRRGEGTYTIKGKKMIVNFDEAKIDTTGYRVERIKPPYGDANTYIIEGDSSLYTGSVAVMNSKEEVITSGLLNQAGQLKIHVPKAEKPTQIFIAVFGYETLTIPLLKGESNRFYVSLRNTFDQQIPKQTKVYKIKSKGGLLHLVDDDRSYVLYPRTY